MILAKDIKLSDLESKYVFIIEHIDIPIESIDTPLEVVASPANGKYEYIATVAKFGILNENGREYQRDDYLAHLPGLKEKILRKQLIGELDHPQNYDTSLKNVSHMITDIWYDNSDDTVKIKLQLLDTPYGRIAKILIDSGVQLSVSSRSAGKVDAIGKVTLFRVFTFDLVAEPGFAQAILQPSVSQKLQENFSILNESLNTIKNNSITNNMELLCESIFYGDKAKIYKVNENDLSLFEKNIKIQKNDNMSITKAEFEAYTQSIQKNNQNIQNELFGLKKLLESTIGQVQAQSQVQEEENDDDSSQAQSDAQGQVQIQGEIQVQAQPDVQAQIQSQVQVQPNVQVQAQNQLGDFLNVQQPTEIGQLGAVPQIDTMNPVGGMDQMPNMEVPTIDNTVETVQKLIDYINFIAKQLQVVMGHNNVISEMLNKSISYQETMGKTLNEHINFTNKSNVILNETIGYIDVLKEVINENSDVTEDLIKYANLSSTRLNEAIDLTNLISDTTNKAISFSEFNANLFNEHVDFTNTLANRINVDGFTSGKISNVSDRNLSDNVATITESQKNIIASVDKVLSKINENSNTSVLEAKYPFLKLLSESNKNIFYGLDSDTKVEIIATLESGVYFNENDVMSTINGIKESKNKNLPSYLKLMPDSYKMVYESMSEDEKANIHRKAVTGFHRLNTPYQVKTFWDTLQLQERIRILEENLQINNKNTAINENKSQGTEGFITIGQLAEYQRGYSANYIQQLTSHARTH